MLNVEQLVRDLSKKFYNLQKATDNIKRNADKKHSRRSSHSSWKSHSQSWNTVMPPTFLPQEEIQTTPGVEHMVTLAILGAEYVATHLAMDAPAVLFTVLFLTGVVLPQLNKPGAG